MLRWEVTVPTQAIGPKAYGIDYAFRLEYDKKMNLTGLPVAGG